MISINASISYSSNIFFLIHADDAVIFQQLREYAFAFHQDMGECPVIDLMTAAGRTP
jgi:hypothetical protein